MPNSTFVSPGIFVREKDLTFVVRQVGVTTLGIAGESPIGPAFEPIAIKDYNEYMSFFGGLNSEKFKGNNYPKYEAGYIAKSYLTQSNQLYMTRILGLSGYKAGPAWAITSVGGINNGVATVSAYTSCPGIFNFVALSSNTTGNITISTIAPHDPSYITMSGFGVTQSFFTSGTDITSLIAGGTTSIPTTYFTNGTTVYAFSASSLGVAGWVASGLTGCLTGTTTLVQSTPNNTYNNTVLALLRSRGAYDSVESLNYYVTSLSINPGGTNTNALAEFTLSGSVVYGASSGQTFSYVVSFDPTKKSYLPNVLGTTTQDKNTFIYLEEFFGNTVETLASNGSIIGLTNGLTSYASQFNNYLQQWSTPQTPWVVSEVRGNKVFRLFRLVLVTDGEAGNTQYKFSISNIKLDTKEFDLLVREFDDLDSRPQVVERFARLNLQKNSPNFIARKVGTLNGDFELKSRRIMIEMADDFPEDAFPAGFEGYLQRNYGSASPTPIIYKQTYGTLEKIRKVYLGLSDITGIDQDFFNYKAVNGTTSFWTGHTHGFHMDSSASGVTVQGATIPFNTSLSLNYTPVFDTGCCLFQSEVGVVGTTYEDLRSRKFTFAAYGGFDGWDEYRLSRTNLDSYAFGGSKATLGLASGVIGAYTTYNNTQGNSSDYYAYYEGIHTFDNPVAVNVNVFVTPGITSFDNQRLVEDTIDMIEEERADSVYVLTTPDLDSAGDVYAASDITDNLDGILDSNYSATYWPWIQMEDTENLILMWLPPTLEVVRNFALTDNIAFPWYASAGVERGSTKAKKARVKLKQFEVDDLYQGRVNPMITDTNYGVLIWGNKTLQIEETALCELQIRRMLLQARKLISAACVRLLFDPNDSVARSRFLGLVNPILDGIRKERGLVDFRITVSNDPEEIDRKEMSAKLYLKPSHALEEIIIDFILTPTGASFDNV
jgi:hypothetical protein